MEPSSEIIFDPLQGVNLLFLKNDNDHLVELVEPAAAENPVSKILSKNGASLYHICYVIENLDQKIEELKSQRFKLVLPLLPRLHLMEGTFVFFIIPTWDL